MNITRRDFLVSASSLAALPAVAKPIRSDLAGLVSALEDFDGWDNSTAKNYILDGLVAMWDGIENSGWGNHNPNAVVWKDLVGNLDIVIPGADCFASDHLVHSSGTPQSIYPTTLLQDTDFTIESVFAITRETSFNSINTQSGTGGTDASGFAQYTLKHVATGNRICARVSYGNGKTWNYSPFDTKCTEIPLNEIVSISCGADFTTRYWSPYVNGRRESTLSRTSGPVGYVSPNPVRVFCQQPCSGYCLRLYDRVLSDAEVAYNYSIDQERFGVGL